MIFIDHLVSMHSSARNSFLKIILTHIMLNIRPNKMYIVGLWSDQSSRIVAAMWGGFLCFSSSFLFSSFLKTFLYLMDYFNTVLNIPPMKLAGTSMLFCK